MAIILIDVLFVYAMMCICSIFVVWFLWTATTTVQTIMTERNADCVALQRAKQFSYVLRMYCTSDNMECSEYCWNVKWFWWSHSSMKYVAGGHFNHFIFDSQVSGTDVRKSCNQWTNKSVFSDGQILLSSQWMALGSHGCPTSLDSLLTLVLFLWQQEYNT